MKLVKTMTIFSSPVRKYRKSYCTTPGVGVGVGIGVNKNVKVLRQSFKTLYDLLNPQMDLVYIWYVKVLRQSF